MSEWVQMWGLPKATLWVSAREPRWCQSASVERGPQSALLQWVVHLERGLDRAMVHLQAPGWVVQTAQWVRSVSVLQRALLWVQQRGCQPRWGLP